MKGHLALATVAALALAALPISLPLRAAENPPQPGTIVTVAGTGAAGYSGDNGPATRALLNGPTGLALDGAGNLYITEWVNDRVRKVSLDGTITTVVGTGKLGFSGDGGKATDAELNRPGLLAVDGAGNLFIAEQNNHRVRKVTPEGIITTVAGGGPVEETTDPYASPRKGGFSGDNGPATDARLNGPFGLAVDARGNLFIADVYNYRVRRVDAATGIITTVAGIGRKKYAGDGGLATDTGLRGPNGLAVDAMGSLLIADSGIFQESDGLGASERVLKVFGVAAPGLLAGMAFPR